MIRRRLSKNSVFFFPNMPAATRPNKNRVCEFPGGSKNGCFPIEASYFRDDNWLTYHFFVHQNAARSSPAASIRRRGCGMPTRASASTQRNGASKRGLKKWMATTNWTTKLGFLSFIFISGFAWDIFFFVAFRLVFSISPF